MAKQLLILGATGSIGTSTLKVVRDNPDNFSVFGLVGGRNHQAMLELCREFSPRFVAMADADASEQLAGALSANGLSCELVRGQAEINQLAQAAEVDLVMAAIVGAAGLHSTMAAVKAGKTVLLANKESLVMSGSLLMEQARRSGATIMPVDSEHNAIYQCMPDAIQTQLGYCDLAANGVSKVLLTGSGGPFRYTPVEQLSAVTPAQACAHPNWSMGQKISVDSATMMNKGLEYIEAKHLFNTQRGQIEVVIHPQSIIHSMVQYCDGSVLAQLGQPDMATPIAYAMAYPQRVPTSVEPLDFVKLGELSFLAPDFSRYPCLKLAIDACYHSQAATTTLNAANEIAVAAFLSGQLEYLQISQIVEQCLERIPSGVQQDSIEALLELDQQVRATAAQLVGRV